MNGLSTITQKGQIVIPLSIRNLLDLKPKTRVYISVQDNAVILKPVLSIDEAFGMIKSKKTFSKKTYKKIIRDAVIEKFKRKMP